MKRRQLLVAAIGLAAASPLALAQSFAGKTVTIIVGYKPGGGYDSTARLLARYLPKHLPGKPTVIVQNMPGGNSIIAANHMYNVAKPDGLTIGTFNRNLPIAQILRDSLADLALHWPELRPMLEQLAQIAEVAALCDGWNGRQVRKLILAGLAQRLEVAKNPALLTFDDLREAARKRGGVEWVGGAAPTSRELFPDVPKEMMHDHDHGHVHAKTRRKS